MRNETRVSLRTLRIEGWRHEMIVAAIDGGILRFTRRAGWVLRTNGEAR